MTQTHDEDRAIIHPPLKHISVGKTAEGEPSNQRARKTSKRMSTRRTNEEEFFSSCFLVRADTDAFNDHFPTISVCSRNINVCKD